MSNESVIIRMKKTQREGINIQDSQSKYNEFNLLQSILNERVLKIKDEQDLNTINYNNDDKLDKLSKELLKEFKRIVVTSNKQTDLD